MHKDAFTAGDKIGVLIAAICLAGMMFAFKGCDVGRARQEAQLPMLLEAEPAPVGELTMMERR